MVPNSKELLKKAFGALLLITTIGLATWQSVGHALFFSTVVNVTVAAGLV